MAFGYKELMMAAKEREVIDLVVFSVISSFQDVNG